MNYPKISIVTPNYNKAQFLESTILSVLSQGYPNLEYIIIDGGSTDGSVDIIKKYANQLAYWVSEPDEGMYDAIKKGFEHSTGDIMAWINSDDMYHPYAFSTVADIFVQYSQIVWLSGMSTCYDVRNRTVFVKEQKYFSHLRFLMHDYQHIQQESTFWRRSLYDKSGGISSDYKLAGDFDLWMRFSRIEKLYIVNALLGGFRITKDQLSNDINRYCEEAETIIINEHVSDDEYMQIKKIRRQKAILSVLRKLRIFNWQLVERLFMHCYEEEEKCHRLFFDFESNKFRIQ